MVGKEPPQEEKIRIVVNYIKEHGKEGEDGKYVSYRDLQDYCANLFEGVRLLLKIMKEKGIVSYEGIIPSFSAKIILLKDD